MSSTEAEYISIWMGVKEVMWIRRLVQGLGILDGASEPTKMLVDNQASISLSHNSSVNRRTKHIDVRYHFTRQAIQDGVVRLEYCRTEDMVADMLTKALGRVKLQKFVCGSGLHECESASSN